MQLKSDIGASEIIDQALLGGGIDMYPEYVGVLLSELANERERPSSAAAAYDLAKQFEETRGFTLLEPTPFTDSNALAVKPATAAPPQVDRRPRGRRRSPRRPSSGRASRGSSGSRASTGSRTRGSVPLPIGDQYGALDEGSVDAAAVFTTDGQLAGRPLRDPRATRAASSRHSTSRRW